MAAISPRFASHGNSEDSKGSGDSTEDELSSTVPAHSTVPQNSLGVSRSTSKARDSPRHDVPRLAARTGKPPSSLPRASKNLGLFAPYGSKNLTPKRRAQNSNTAKHLGVTAVKKGAPTTPHAIWALEKRRNAGLTPGRNRRKSGRLQRETPRETLRNLGKILARTSRATEPTVALSQGTADTSEDDELENTDLPKPMLSMPNSNGEEEEEEEDSFQMQQLRTPIPLGDPSPTQRSIELARHFVSEQPPGRLSRGSFGTVRLSDRFASPDDQDPQMWDKDPAEKHVRQRLSGTDESAHEVSPNTRNVDDDTQNLKDVGSEWIIRPQSILSITRGEQLLDPYGDTNFAFEIPARAARHLSPHILDRNDMPGLGGHGEGPPAKGVKSISMKSSKVRRHRSKAPKISRHGLPYSSLPSKVIKNLISALVRQPGSNRNKISKHSLGAIVEATDWFFEQLSEDLTIFARHGGRKTIDESDVITLMKRYSTSIQQRQLKATATLFSLAQSRLPRELVQRVRMPPMTKIRLERKPPMEISKENRFDDDD